MKKRRQQWESLPTHRGSKLNNFFLSNGILDISSHGFLQSDLPVT